MKELWELRYCLLVVGGLGVFCAAVFRFPWILAVPVALFLLMLPMAKIRRSRFLKQKGYFLLWGREGRSSYEELAADGTRMVELPSGWTEPGRPELFIPTRAEWDTKAPGWAAHRRDEIFQKVIAIWNGAEIHYPADWPLPPGEPGD